MAFSSNQGPVEWCAASLYRPPLESLVNGLKSGLSEYFGEVTVKVVKSPDLRKWGNCATAGLCGNPKLAEVGGPQYIDYLMTKKEQQKIYSIDDVLKLCHSSKALVFGAAAASSKLFPNNAELIPNLQLTDNGNVISNNTHYAEVDKLKNPVTGKYDSIKIGCLSNLFLCDGNNNGNVLYISCKKRIKEKNFTNSIRSSLTDKVLKKLNDKTLQIGLGGIIKVNKGKIRGHIMADYANYHCHPPQEWLNYYDVGPDLVMFTTMITDDPSPNKSMGLRLEHTHYYSLDGSQQAGHYHDDVTPDTIEYEGYFNLAQCVYRADNAVYKLSQFRKSKL